jgi:nuclear transport factor 2 (NTF2) superfamily protein
MMWSNRLTVIGSKTQVQRFQKNNWDRHLRARYCELAENSPTRFACQFKTERFPLESLRRLSGRWQKLILLLDFESEENRIKGLAKAEAGDLEHWEVNY